MLLALFFILLTVVLSIKFLWFVVTIPFRVRAQLAAERDAATQRELVIVAAMTEELKAEYWARKHAESQPRPEDIEPASTGKAIAILLMAFFGIGGGAFALMVIFGPQH